MSISNFLTGVIDRYFTCIEEKFFIRKEELIRVFTQKKIILFKSDKGEAFIVKNFLSQDDTKELKSVSDDAKPILYDFRWFGKPIRLNRPIIVYGDISHSFGGVKIPTEHKWPSILYELLQRINKEFDTDCNMCQLNRYPSGKFGILPHKDGELFAKNRFVGTISLGATRKIQSVRPTSQTIEFNVEEGDFVLYDRRFAGLY